MVNAWIHSIGWTLIHFIWQGAIIAGLLWVALRVFNQHRATTRYGIASLALLLMIAAPLATLWTLQPTNNADLGSVSGWTVYLAPTKAAAAISATPETIHFDDYLPLAVGLWTLGVFMLCLRLLGGWLSIERMRRQYCQPVDPAWQIRLDSLARRLGIERSVRLLESVKFNSPATIGVFHAVVIVPIGFFTRLPGDQIEALLMHELAHIRRQDYLVNLLQSFTETALFYHPAVWWVSSVIRREREHCCDEIVVRTLADPVGYARALTSLEENRAYFSQLSLSSNGGSLMNRIQRILAIDSTPVRRARSPWLAPAGIAATALIASGMFFGGSQMSQAQISPPPIPPSTHSPKRAADPAAIPSAKSAVSKIQTANPAAARSAKAAILSIPLAGSQKSKVPIAAPASMKWRIPKVSAPTPKPKVALFPGLDPLGLPIRGLVTEHFTKEKFEVAVMKIARLTETSLAIAPGNYPSVSVNLHNQNPLKAIATLCFAAGATWSLEEGIVKISMNPALDANPTSPVPQPVGDDARSPVPSDSLPDPAPRSSNDEASGSISIDLQKMQLADAIKNVAYGFRRQITVGPGTFPLITLKLSNVSFIEAMDSICQAGNAKWQQIGDRFEISPKS